MVKVIIAKLDEIIIIILKYIFSFINFFFLKYLFYFIYFKGLINGIEFGDFSESVTQTDFVLDDNGHITKMKFIAGFLGIGQNPTTGALRPCLGWVTALPNPEQSTEKN
jgi:hypothetical protein